MRSRSTRQAILSREEIQAHVIALLVDQGHVEAASRLAACQANRIISPTSAWRARCRNPGCYSCWNGELDNLWSTYRRWSAEDLNTFPVALPADIERLAVPLRRSLRDLRDREARRDPKWSDVAFYGAVEGHRAVLRVSPWRVPPKAATAVLRRLWPDLDVLDADCCPTPMTDPHLRAALAIRRRGSEPLRIEVQPQRAEPDTFVPFVIATNPAFLNWSPISYHDY